MAALLSPGALGLLLVCPALLIACQGEPQDRRPGPAPFLADVETHALTSTISGREYQVSVALPMGYAESDRSYPTLYAVDANGQFGIVVETTRILNIADLERQVPELIIVGVGYPVGGWQTAARVNRGFDLFAGEDPLAIAATGQSGGGAPEYLRFFQEQLIPFIDANYRTDPSDRGFYGHSAGGFFALYSLLEGRGTFSRVVAASPSLWWNAGGMFEIEETFAATDTALPARLFLSAGLSERDYAIENYNCCFMVSNVRRFADVLTKRQYEGLEWYKHEFEGENHQSVLPGSVSRGLRYVYSSLSTEDFVALTLRAPPPFTLRPREQPASD